MGPQYEAQVHHAVFWSINNGQTSTTFVLKTFLLDILRSFNLSVKAFVGYITILTSRSLVLLVTERG